MRTAAWGSSVWKSTSWAKLESVDDTQKKGSYRKNGDCENPPLRIWDLGLTWLDFFTSPLKNIPDLKICSTKSFGNVLKGINLSPLFMYYTGICRFTILENEQSKHPCPQISHRGKFQDREVNKPLCSGAPMNQIQARQALYLVGVKYLGSFQAVRQVKTCLSCHLRVKYLPAEAQQLQAHAYTLCHLMEL